MEVMGKNKSFFELSEYSELFEMFTQRYNIIGSIFVHIGSILPSNRLQGIKHSITATFVYWSSANTKRL
jgi:hypothetical protein